MMTYGMNRYEVVLRDRYFLRDLLESVVLEDSLDQIACRGTGTATIGIVKEVAGSYDKGTVAVLENQPAYTVTIEFIDTFGIPPNIEDLKKAVRAVVPAHLDLVYQYRYILYADLAGYTYDQIQASGLTYGDLQTKLPMGGEDECIRRRTTA